jgi:hypothetical protein
MRDGDGVFGHRCNPMTAPYRASYMRGSQILCTLADVTRALE